MPDQDALLRWRIDVLEKTVLKVTDDLRQVEERNEERDRERAKAERNQLLAGITFLGGIILTLFGVIWRYVIVKGGS